MARVGRRGKVSGYWPAVVLFFVAVALGVLSYVILPSGSNPPVPASFGLVVLPTPTQIVDINVSESQSLGTDQVTVDATVKSGPAAPAGPITVDAYYPKDLSMRPCAAVYQCHRYPPDVLNLRFDLVPSPLPPRNGYLIESANLSFAGPPLGFDSGNGIATAELPTVQVPLYVVAQQGTLGSVEVHYKLLDARSYDWTTGQRPVNDDGGSVTWYLPLQQTGTTFESAASSAGAVNLSAQQRDQLLTFIVGALVGVTGALSWAHCRSSSTRGGRPLRRGLPSWPNRPGPLADDPVLVVPSQIRYVSTDCRYTGIESGWTMGAMVEIVRCLIDLTTMTRSDESWIDPLNGDERQGLWWCPLCNRAFGHVDGELVEIRL